MATVSNQVAQPASPAATPLYVAPAGAPPATLIVTLVTAGAEVWLGGANVAAGQGFPLKNGTAGTVGNVLPTAQVTIPNFTGTLFFIGNAGSEVVAYLANGQNL
jgi:hypothetical protein